MYKQLKSCWFLCQQIYRQSFTTKFELHIATIKEELNNRFPDGIRRGSGTFVMHACISA